MYRIITDNEKILKYAKECGAQIMEIKKPLVVEVGNRDKKIPADIVNKFLLKFKGFCMKSIEAQVLNYVLEHSYGCNGSQAICAVVAKKFKKSVEWADAIIGKIYVDCITNLPEEYKKHFYEYECYIHMRATYRYEFLMACQEYLYKNTAIVDNTGDKLHIIL